MKLHWQILLGILIGVLVGAVAGDLPTVIDAAGFIGDLFLKLLRMVVVPLVLTSIVSGIARLGAGQDAGRLFGATILVYIGTSFAAIVTGLVVVNIVQPGSGAEQLLQPLPEGFEPHVLTLRRLFLEMVPSNPFGAAAEGQMLPLIVFSVLFGLAVARVGAAGDAVRDLFEGGFAAMLELTEWILRLAPVGIAGLIARIVATTGFDAFRPLGWYVACVVLALVLHAVVTLPLLLRVLARRRPTAYARAVSPALLTAFSTASSSATLPLTMQRVESAAGVPNKVAGFSLPLGATINMDGTALYECVAAIFIAQVYGLDLTIAQQVLVVLTALLASIGAAGIPMAGLVMMSVILNAVGLPLEGIGLILAVDRILDMMRTTVNVWSDTVAAAVVAQWINPAVERGELT
ncbi:MAG: dicarboxylate/amino acid:cation symporter [Candidatus Dadabacteria bacterium]|nr:MAG: dicarboxylate/amino acid:cation symporter [Candidatus Dadabacteria bacterium]